LVSCRSVEADTRSGQRRDRESAVRVALGQPEASFFRFPALRHSPELLAYLSTRNIGIFSTDIDSFDFKMRKPEQVVDSVVAKLKKHGKGIVLMHDFQRPTSLALPELLVQLKTNGYKIVQVKAKEPVQTLAEYDQQLEKELGGGTANSRPILSVVRTITE
jgi:peptidoglycan/xylan/chitin deacetylase (PgdA/CDA1 family)